MAPTMDKLTDFFEKRDRKKHRAGSLAIYEVDGQLMPSFGAVGSRSGSCYESSNGSINGSRCQLDQIAAVGDLEDNVETVSIASAPVEVTEGDAEWKEFAQEQKIDLDNLKIGSLQMDLENAGSDSDDGDDDSEATKTVTSAWKIVEEEKEEETKTVQESICEAVDAGADIKTLKKKATAMNAKALLKQQQEREMQPALLPIAGGRRGKAAAPNLNNAEVFPTLAAAPAPLSKSAKKNARKKAKKAALDNPEAEASNDDQQPEQDNRAAEPSGVYKPPRRDNGEAAASGVYRPPRREHTESTNSYEDSRFSRGTNYADTSRLNKRDEDSGVYGNGGRSSGGAFARRGGDDSGSSGAWSRGGGGGSSNAWGRGGDDSGSSGAWSRGGGGSSNAWTRGGGGGGVSGPSITDRGANAWATISNGARNGGSAGASGAGASGAGASGAGASNVYVPPSMRAKNRFGALNDQN